MPIPSGFTYKDGGYWNAAGEGPFGFAVGSSVPVLFGGGGGGGGLTPEQIATIPIVPGIAPGNSAAVNTAAFNAAVLSMAEGQSLALPAGEFFMDIVPSKSIRIAGSGKPYFSAGTLVGGTIIKGLVDIQNRRNCEVGFLGINQIGLPTSTFVNGVLAGTSTVNDSTSPMNQYVHDISILGRGFAGGSGNSVHGLLFQNGRGGLAERIACYNFLNNYVSRASGVTLNDCESFDAEANAVLFKSASAGGSNDAFDNTAFNVRAYATIDGKYANFQSLAEDGTTKITRNSRFISCLADATGTTTGQAIFAVFGTTNAASNRGSVFVGCTSKGDRIGNSFLAGDNNQEGVIFAACIAEDFGGFSFRSNTTSATNLPSVIGGTCWRSGFADIINANGNWAICEINGQRFDIGNTRPLSSLAPATAGTRKEFISDGLTPSFGAIAVGGGSVVVPVYSDGTNWRVG
jgi:hypothetical protein